MTPLERTEAFYQELVLHYGEGKDREVRAAAKLMLVALDQFKKHGGIQGTTMAEEYLNLLRYDPEKFQRILQSNRSFKRERDGAM